MASDATIRRIVDTTLSYGGVTDPTAAEVIAAEFIAHGVVDTIQHYRSLTVEDELEDEYQSLAVEMAIYAFAKRGVDGVTQFSEAGVQRAYEAGSFPPSMLSRITPVMKTG